MSETRIGVPFVALLDWVLNPLNVAVPVENSSQGQQQQYREGNRQPGLTVGIQPYIGNLPMGQRNYPFKDQTLADLMTAAGVDVQAQWQSALSDMADVFPVLADPTPEQMDDGLPYEMQLDAWRAQFTPNGSNGVTATLGFYAKGKPKVTEDGKSTAQAYQELVFADAGVRETRANNIAAITSNIAQQQSIIDSEDATAEQKAQATETKKAYQRELDRLNSQLVGSMEDLLGSVAVSTSIGALMTAVFSTLKATDSDWENVDVAGLMAAFSARFGQMIAA